MVDHEQRPPAVAGLEPDQAGRAGPLHGPPLVRPEAGGQLGQGRDGRGLEQEIGGELDAQRPTEPGSELDDNQGAPSKVEEVVVDADLPTPSRSRQTPAIVSSTGFRGILEMVSRVLFLPLRASSRAGAGRPRRAPDPPFRPIQ